MTDPRTTSPLPQRTFRRRWSFRLVLVGLVLVALECISFAVFWLVDGTPFTWSRLADEQHAAATAAMDETTSKDGAQGQILFPCLHPYAGFVYHERLNTENWKKATGRSVNRFGFNDENSPIQKRRADRVIVAIFGGSVAAWVGFSGADALVAALKESPRYRDKEFVVLKLAVGGHKQPQQLMVLNWILSQGGELDLAIDLDGFNECHLSPTNVLAKVHPFYPVLWQQLVGEADRERQRRVGEVVYLRDERRGWAAAFDGSAWRASVTAQLAWRLYDRYLSARLGAASQRLETWAPEDLPFEVRGPGVADYTMENIGQAVADTWQRCSLQMHRICAANGIEYHHFLQPNQYVADSKPMDAAERATAIDEGSLQALAVQTGYPQLAARIPLLQREGVHVHDLRSVFAEVKEPVYIDAFCHVNELGNRLLGQRIAEAILGR